MRLYVLLALALAGCGGDKSGCTTDQECVVGDVCVNGQCRALAGADLSGVVGDLGAGGDLATPIPDGWNPDALAASCSFNGDGTIVRGEEPFMVGLGALFAVNAAGSNVPVDNVAHSGTWDFSAAVSGEAKQFDQLVDPSGQWWAADFPTATYGERIDDGQAVYGVFRVGSDKLEMLGVVSEQQSGYTELKYTTPIVVLQFPMSVGTNWTSESDVSGTFSGVAFFAHEKYLFSVGERGMTRVPAATFDTLRLKMSYTQTYGALVTTRITYLHLAECYGAVARVRSKDNETSADFTQAAEYRRLANP